VVAVAVTLRILILWENMVAMLLQDFKKHYIASGIAVVDCNLKPWIKL
jgi:hypothetical protein